MRKSIVILGTTVTIGISILTACNSPQTKNGEVAMSSTDTAVQPIAEDTANVGKSEWQKFKTDAQARITQTDDSIAAFNSKMRRADKKVTVKYDRSIAELEQRNNDLKNRLDTYQAKGKDDWQKFKMDFNNSMDTVALKWKELTSRNESSM